MVSLSAKIDQFYPVDFSSVPSMFVLVLLIVLQNNFSLSVFFGMKTSRENYGFCL
jgi:hypothetical protein